MTVCIVVNGEKFQSGNHHDLDLDWTMPNVELVSGFKWIEPLFFELSCTQTDKQPDSKTDTQKDTHTDKHEYSIVAVDKPQL